MSRDELPQQWTVIDIETIRDESLPPPKRPDECPPPPWHQVVCLGWMQVDLGDPSKTRIGALLGDEPEILHAFAAGFRKRPGADICSFGGRRFDLPVLVARMLKHGVPWPWWWKRHGARVRYKTEGHVDLCDELSEHGAATYSGLDVWARLVGLEGKSGHGGDVEAMWRDGKRSEVAAYCLDDVRLTAAVLLRWLVVRGDIASDEEERHRAAMAEAQPRERKAA